MGVFGFVLLIVVNFIISWWNARSVGRVWSESKEIGGAMRVLAVSGYIMSIIGFTMVYGTLLILFTILLHPHVPWLVENIVLADLVQLSSDLLFLMIAVAIIPTGIVLWLNSVVMAWKRRSLGNIAVAGWNTFAMIRNTTQVARHAPAALGRVIEALFGGKGRSRDSKAMLAILAIAIVILALLGGWMTASKIMHSSDRDHDLIGELDEMRKRRHL